MEIAKVTVSGTGATVQLMHDIPCGLTGASVKLEYTDAIWAGLIKNVFFVGAKDVAILNAGDTIILPTEVINIPNINARIGICGIDGDQNIAIPTIWADLGTVKPATPLNLGSSPQLPIWAQLMAMIGNLRGLNTTAQNNLVAAVNEVLSDGTGGGSGSESGGNVDLTGYAKVQWVQENYQPKGNYLTEHQDISGKLDAEDLPEAINDALAQAKESGEFDGEKGEKGEPFTYEDLTEEQKAELKNGAVLYNPQTLLEEQKTQARENIGAAPAGYGLGSDTSKQLSTDNDLNNCAENGFYSWALAPINAPFDNGIMIVATYDWARKVQYAWCAANGNSARRIQYANTWGKWEYVNPPMVPGVEYRTTERYMEKPVYTKLMNYGTPVDGASLTFADSGATAIRHAGRLGNNSLPFADVNNAAWYANAFVDRDQIRLSCAANWGAEIYSWYHQVWYVKD